MLTKGISGGLGLEKNPFYFIKRTIVPIFFSQEMKCAINIRKIFKNQFFKSAGHI